MMLKTRKILTSLIITLILLIQFIGVFNVQASSIILTIPNASQSLSLCTAYEEYFYVYRDHEILRYKINTRYNDKVLDLGETVIVTKMLRRGQDLYMQINDGGTYYYTCYTLPDLEHIDTVANSELTPHFNHRELSNIICLYNSTGDNTKFWAWAYTVETGGGAYNYYEPDAEILSGYCENDTYPVIYSIAHGCGSLSTGGLTIYHRIYVYDVDNDNVYNFQFSFAPLALGKCGSWSSYLQTTVSLTQVSDAGYDRYSYYWTTSSYLWYYYDADMSFEQLQYDSNISNTFFSVWYHGLRDDSFTTTSYNELDKKDKRTHWLDLEEYWFMIHEDDKDRLKKASFTEGSFSYSGNLALTADVDIDGSYMGMIGVNHYLSKANITTLYVGYVRNSDYRPKVDKIQGLTGSQIGILDSTYTPNASRVYPTKDNFIAVFTQAGSSSLYVNINLIPESDLWISYQGSISNTRMLLGLAGLVALILSPSLFIVMSRDDPIKAGFFCVGSGIIGLGLFLSWIMI